jgi:KEOPS complex subunit Cgi121
MKADNELPGTEEHQIPIAIHQIRCTVDDIGSFLSMLRGIGDQYHVKLICFNRDVIAGKIHAEKAIRCALRSFATGDQIARTLEIEALLYGAGTRQTGLIGPFGIHQGVNECYLCIVPHTPEVWDRLVGQIESADGEDWESITSQKREKLKIIFSITPAEIAITGEERLTDLILERVVLLAINR